jgi:hypothetical protein
LPLTLSSVAKDVGWFKTYTPFASTIKHSMRTSPGYLPVLGIGTVEIPTKRSPNRSGVSSHGSLYLKHVLHVPGFICNVIGGSIGISDGYDVEIGYSPKKKGTIKDSPGKNVAYFDPNQRLVSIKVRNQPGGPKLGPCAFQKDTMYVLSCQWDPSEQQRWLGHQGESGLKNLGSEPARTTDTNPQYTDDEKAFLKITWRNEYHFLLQHGLKIHQEKDRAEGRLILRTFRDKDGSKEKSRYHGLQLEDYQADMNLSFCQLECIEQCYGNRENFLSSEEAESYDSDELREAMAIADAIRAQDG